MKDIVIDAGYLGKTIAPLCWSYGTHLFMPFFEINGDCLVFYEYHTYYVSYWCIDKRNHLMITLSPARSYEDLDRYIVNHEPHMKRNLIIKN